MCVCVLEFPDEDVFPSDYFCSATPLSLGFPLDRWFCDPSFRKVCPCQTSAYRGTANLGVSTRLIFGTGLSGQLDVEYAFM